MNYLIAAAIAICAVLGFMVGCVVGAKVVIGMIRENGVFELKDERIIGHAEERIGSDSAWR